MSAFATVVARAANMRIAKTPGPRVLWAVENAATADDRGLAVMRNRFEHFSDRTAAGARGGAVVGISLLRVR